MRIWLLDIDITLFWQVLHDNFGCRPWALWIGGDSLPRFFNKIALSDSSDGVKRGWFERGDASDFSDDLDGIWQTI
jgi:hypothetical protein